MTSLRIVVRAPNWLGDCVMSTPFLFELRTAHPQAHVAVICRPEHRTVFEKHPSVNETIDFPPSESSLDRRFEVAYILPTSFSSAFAFYGARIPKRIGHAAEWRSLFLTQPVRLDPRFHYARRYLSLLGLEGLPVHRFHFFFPLTENGRGVWRNLKSSLGNGIRSPVLTIAPGSRAPARRYFSERFASVADLFVRASGGSVVLVGSAEDEIYARQVCERAASPLINICGKLTLEGLGAVLKESVALLTNESGAMHVAWALGVPSVVLAGPSEVLLTAPWGDAASIVQHRELACVPCVKNECPRSGDGYKECLKLIEVEEVWKVLTSLASFSSVR